MRHHGSREDTTFYPSSDSQSESPNHRFLNEAKTLVAKMNAVSGVKEIISCPIWRSPARIKDVATVFYVQEGSVMVRYFARGICQDIKVECDPSSIGKIRAVVDKYAQDFKCAHSKRRIQRELQDRELAGCRDDY